MSIKLPDDTASFKSDPNVVPMIDVLLVLLIIFMMQIPMNRMAMDVQVPAEEKTKKKQNEKSDQIVLELLENGGYAINTKPVAIGALDVELHKIYDERPAKLMFVKVAGKRKYQDVIVAMDIARGAGVQVIGFVPPPDEAAAKKN
ncbi:MAG: biopolymer transporter ExbD [Gemmatimonadetes bacterium]|nr:biopolymer transporter ExbD [Gemmatimonadota bacterium]